MIFSEEGAFRARAKIREGLLYKAFADSGTVCQGCTTNRHCNKFFYAVAPNCVGVLVKCILVFTVF
jgi:hypothetical protein